MTMTEGSAPAVPPSAFPDNWASDQSPYGFHCEKWLDLPTTCGPDWFSLEERSRREANAYAYRQKGTKENWHRYLSLGFFVFEDCFECDKLWAAMEDDPLQLHRSIWYNFRFHVDQEMQIPPKLHDWALNVSRAYLQHFDPSTLHNTDTLAYSWETMPFMTASMEIDDQSEWIPVPGRRRSKSPPSALVGANGPAESANSLPSPQRPVQPPRTIPLLSRPSVKPRPPPKKPRTQQISWSQGLPPVTTVTEDDEESDDGQKRTADNSDTDVSSKGTQKTLSKTATYKTVATNDGTYRVTVKWTPPERTHLYEGDKKRLNDSIFEIVCGMVPPEVGSLYRWESEDLVVSKSVPAMSAPELRDFISPTISFLHAQHRIVFGLRIGFDITPGQWMRTSTTKKFFKAQQIEVSVSNSKSTSGKMVTAGYVLLKAPNTTQLSRYTQFLRSTLPENTPYFDVVRHKKTPMDQLIPHLRIQCGEKHVTPLCQALLPVLTGRGSAMFIPRYALGTMTEEKIRSHFQFHEKWARSLKAIPMSPQVNHLDQKRTEYNDDGTTLERSTREWISTLTAPDQTSPALCDVVNGPPDHKAYLLVPSHYFEIAQRAWSQYKSRLYPPSHREARFRDTLPGLPDVIHIQAEIESHVSFLEHLSEASVWQTAPTSPQLRPPVDDSRRDNLLLASTRRPPAARSAWPTPAEASQAQHRNRTSSHKHASEGEADLQSTGGSNSIDTEDRSTESTHSLTHASRASTMDTRYQDLEKSMQRKLRELAVSGQQSSNRLLSMEQQFIRIDDLDKKVAAVNDKLDLATEHMKTSTKTQQNISDDMEHMKTYTTQQFAEINQRLLSNMESQHQISTTMLDLREHFEKMSKFMASLATKMELDRKLDSEKTSPARRARGPSSAEARHISHDSGSTGSASTNSGSSQRSKASVQSTASSTVFRSPEKKKLRSHRKGDGQSHTASVGDDDLSDEFDAGRRPVYMEVCATLDDAFGDQEDTFGPSTQTEHVLLPASTQPPTPPAHPIPQQTAPLNPQYNLSMDLAGAGNK